MHFQDWFWGVPDNPTLGVTKLHARLITDIVQVEELSSLLQLRIAAEEQYASMLMDLARKPLRPNGFGQDDSLISNIYCSYQKEMQPLSASHKSIADRLSMATIPLKAFIEDARTICFPKKSLIDALVKRFDAALLQTKTLNQIYREKSAQAAAETKKYTSLSVQRDVPETNVMINFGTRSLTSDEFNDFISTMQREIINMDVGSILGAYKDCYLGSDMLKYVETKHHVQESDAMAFLNDLVSNNFIRPISSRFAHFMPSSHYQWKRTSLEIDNELPHRRCIRLAECAEYDYKKSVRAVETLRQSVYIASAEYMDTIQKVLRKRIGTIKTTLTSCAEVENIPVCLIRDIQERLFLFLETLDVDKEIKLFSERDRTGVKPAAPYLFEKYLQGPIDVVFGLELDELHSRSGVRVPPIMRKCFKYISDIQDKAVLEKSKQDPSIQLTQNDSSKNLESWMLPITNLTTVMALRNELDSGKVKESTLRKYPVCTIINVLRIYLMELPNSVCSNDLYEPLKLLYLSKYDDLGTMRFNSLRSLLATMSSAHFHTLTFFISYIRTLVSGIDPADSRITDLSISLGPYILRPEIENSVSVHDKHRGRLVRDLLVHYDDIISADILSATNSAEDLPEGAGSFPKSPTALDSEGEEDVFDLIVTPESSPLDSEKSGKTLHLTSALGTHLKASLVEKRSANALNVNTQNMALNGTPLNLYGQNSASAIQQGQNYDNTGVVGDMFTAAKRVGSSWLYQASDITKIFTTQPVQIPSSSDERSDPSIQLQSLSSVDPGFLSTSVNEKATLGVSSSVGGVPLSWPYYIRDDSPFVTADVKAPITRAEITSPSSKLFDIVLSDESDVEIYNKPPAILTTPFI
ncbi:hypothetical protein BASA84_000788 [Batrachochytrium salamandrivorans]|nr:hypothetical protein BASA84_000788 [Batrachochytrium salamandrivorans]